jgi:CheY-like chemotaxis protein
VQTVIGDAGGAIEVSTAPGKGTTMDIILPATRAPLESLTQGLHALPRGRERIVLVEDQHDLRDVTKQQLVLLGYEVVSYPSAEDALLHLNGSEPAPLDLLFTDVVLPGMSGAALAERLRAQRPELPVLYMSGYTDEVVLARGVDARHARFVHKPFAFQELAHALREALAAWPDEASGMAS